MHTIKICLNILMFATFFSVLTPAMSHAQTSDEESSEVNYERINREQDYITRSSNDCQGLVCCSGPDCDFDAMLFNLTHIIRKILELAFVFIAVMFAYAGFKYMTSHGDTGEISAAHSMFQKAVIGMIITLCSFLIIELITSSLGLDENIIKLVK